MLDWTDAPKFGRRLSLMHTLEILHQRNRSPLIVEIGTSEAYSPDGLGNALLAFAWYAGKYGGRVISVEISEGTVRNSREILRKYVPEYSEVPEIVCADAWTWASQCPGPIGLLYMDAGMEASCSWRINGQELDSSDLSDSFYWTLYRKFPESCFDSGSLMLWDDTSPESYQGKGIVAIPKLLANGWKRLELRTEPVFPMVLLGH